MSQCARNALDCAHLFVSNWDQNSTKASETDINRIANLLRRHRAVWRLSNTPLNGKNVILQWPVDTHWHVGEEIAAAEKEALPEATG